MNLTFLAQLVGVVSVFFIAVIGLYVSVTERNYVRYGRVGLLWMCIYILFLFFLRLLSILKLGTQDELRIISGFTSLIPLIALIVQYFLLKKIRDNAQI